MHEIHNRCEFSIVAFSVAHTSSWFGKPGDFTSPSGYDTKYLCINLLGEKTGLVGLFLVLDS
jgi:hypothetical protein